MLLERKENKMSGFGDLKGKTLVGIIGILNGLFGSDEHSWGHISADCEGSKVKRFRLLPDSDVHKYTANKANSADTKSSAAD